MTINDKNSVFIPVTFETQAFLVGNGIDISKAVWRSNFNGTFFKAVSIPVDEAPEGSESVADVYRTTTERERGFSRRHINDLTLDKPYEDSEKTPEHPSDFNLEELIMKKELIDQLYTLLDELEEKDRKIITMRFFEDCTQQQIADTVLMSQTGVAKRLKQILRKLRDQLKNFK